MVYVLTLRGHVISTHSTQAGAYAAVEREVRDGVPRDHLAVTACPLSE
jgi:hypothetical protein